MSSSTDVSQSRILIVDDQESNVRLLELTLRRGGYFKVASTTEARDVCSLHRENRYDLILLDLQMPRMNGYEVLAALRNELPVDVLVLSADPSQRAKSLAAGAKDFLSKPFALAEILLKVQTMLADESVVPAIATVLPLLPQLLLVW
jgi:adenylate cyclase